MSLTFKKMQYITRDFLLKYFYLFLLYIFFNVCELVNYDIILGWR